MRILVIEDEIKLANAIQRALQTQKYIVDVSNRGQEGLDLAVSEEYGLIILDLMLPEIDGIEICKTIRRKGIVTPVIMLTAKGQISDRVVGLDSGADDYLVKPFSFEELFARMRALVRRPSITKRSVLVVDDLTLDPATFKVKRQGKNIDLSAKEFALLEYLMRHKNTIVSKEQIVNNVWNYDSNILPSTIEVHMKHLRDKIDLPFSRKLLYTKRGFGYEIKEG